MYSRMKRLVALILVIVLTGSLLSACGKDKSKTSEKLDQTPEYITRGEWITQLAESFGMTQYENQEPYYKDVTSDNPLFGYVQSSYEWEVLSTDTDEFKPDEYATLGFVVTTSVLAAELDYEQYATSDDVNEAIIKCANEAGITNVEYSDTDALTEPVDRLGAATIVASAVSSYMKIDTPDYVDITYQDKVIDTEKTPIKEITAMGTNSSVKAEEADQVEVGSVLLLPANEEYPFGYCLKVVSKTLNSDGTYTIETAEPEIYEVFDNIDVDTDVAATPEMFIPAEGVSLIQKEASNKVDNLGYVTNSEQIDDLTNAGGNVDSLKTFEDDASNSIGLSISVDSDGEIKQNMEVSSDAIMEGLTANISNPNTEGLENFDKALDALGPVSKDLYKKNDYSFMDDYISGDMSDKDLIDKLDKAKKDLKDKKFTGPKAGKFEKGWEITGSLELESEISVCAKIKFKWGIIPKKLEEMSVTVTNTVESSLEFKGTIGKSITLGKLNIPIAYGFGLTLKLTLELEANGTFKITYQVENAMKISYEDGDIKKTKSQKSSEELSAAIEAEAGLKFSGTITFWGLGLAELGVKVSILLKVEGSVSRGMEYEVVDNLSTGEKYIEVVDKIDFAAGIEIVYPLLTFNLGGDDTLLGLIGIEVEWEAIGEEDLKPKEIWSYSSEDKGTSIILDTFRIDLKKEEPTTEETTTEEITSEEATTEEPSSEEVTTEEESKGGTLQLSDFAVIMNVGETKTLGVTIPDGYSSSDLVWSVSEGTSVKVVNGTITATSEGTSTITVKTADGKYTGQCVVVVN